MSDYFSKVFKMISAPPESLCQECLEFFPSKEIQLIEYRGKDYELCEKCIEKLPNDSDLDAEFRSECQRNGD